MERILEMIARSMLAQTRDSAGGAPYPRRNA